MTHGRKGLCMGRLGRMGRMLHDVIYSANLTVPRSQIHRETNVCIANQKVHSLTGVEHGALIDLVLDRRR